MVKGITSLRLVRVAPSQRTKVWGAGTPSQLQKKRPRLQRSRFASPNCRQKHRCRAGNYYNLALSRKRKTANERPTQKSPGWKGKWEAKQASSRKAQVSTYFLKKYSALWRGATGCTTVLNHRNITCGVRGGNQLIGGGGRESPRPGPIYF